MTRRDVSPEEMALFGELCATAPDLIARRDDLLAAARASGRADASASGLVRPRNVRELIDLVKLGVVSPADARLIVDIPVSVRPPGFWAWLRARLTDVVRHAKLLASGPDTDRQIGRI
jgi:hypothetical protein